MLLAGQWSVDPSTLADRVLEVGEGLSGEFGTQLRRAARGRATQPWWKVW